MTDNINQTQVLQLKMEYNSLDDLHAWAEIMMAREPDFIIGDNYLRRWWVIPRNQFCNVYLHEIRKSDDDRALHDHPWPYRSLILEGSYEEYTPEGMFIRTAGDVIEHEATDLHRLAIAGGGRVISVFMTGPVIREWGFACPKGWVHWRDFVDSRDTGQIGRGCGEMS